MRYILALIPSKQTITAYIHAAQMLFSPVSDGYLLSENSSPHITVCQFECENEQDAISIWEEIGSLRMRSYPIRLTGVSFVKGRGVHKEFYWAEISVGRDEEIMKVHRCAAEIIQSHGLRCLNDSGDLYRPHLTLARIRLPDLVQKWPDTLINDPYSFTLALAKGDNNGQYLTQLAPTLP